MVRYTKTLIDAVEIFSVMAIVLLLALTFMRDQSSGKDLSIDVPVEIPHIARKVGTYFSEAVGDVNCTGSWVADPTCSASCGSGSSLSTFIITVPATGNGTACVAANGTVSTTACNTLACVVVFNASSTCASSCTFSTLEVGVPMDGCVCPDLIIAYFDLTNDSAVALTEGQEFRVLLGAMFDWVFIFSGSANTFVVFAAGSVTNVTKPLTFVGCTVTLNGIMDTTSNVTGGSGVITATEGSKFVLGLAAILQMTGAQFIARRTWVTGRGIVKFVGGRGHSCHSSRFDANVHAHQGDRSRRQAVVDLSSCGSIFNGLTLSITKNVDMSCTVPTNLAYAMTVVDLALQAGATLNLISVSSTSKPILISNSFTWSAGSTILVNMISQPVGSLTVIRYASSGACTLPSTAQVLTPGFTGSWLLTAVVDPAAAGYCLYQVTAAPVATTTAGTSTETGFFSVLLDQDCASFTPVVAKNILAAYYDVNRLSVTTVCASTLMSVTCSGAGAVAYCVDIYNTIINPSSALYPILKPYFGGSRSTGSSSDTKGLLGLIALVAVPVIIIIVVVIVLKMKKPDEDPYADELDEIQTTDPKNFAAEPHTIPSYYNDGFVHTPGATFAPCPSPAQAPTPTY